jgi:hypothetical protein
LTRRALPALRLAGLLLGLALLAWWPASSRWSVDARTPWALVEVEHAGVYVYPDPYAGWRLVAYPHDARMTWESSARTTVQRWKLIRVLRQPGAGTAVVVPLWAPAGLLAAPWAWARLRRRRRPPAARGFDVVDRA